MNNNKLPIVIAIIGIIIAATAANLFGGIYVNPIQLEHSQAAQDESFSKFKTEHGRFEHGQDERIDKIFIAHTSDMRELEKTLGEMKAQNDKSQATNEAILRELGNIRREMRQR